MKKTNVLLVIFVTTLITFALTAIASAIAGTSSLNSGYSAELYTIAYTMLMIAAFIFIIILVTLFIPKKKD